MALKLVERSDQDDRNAEFRRVMNYVAERATADGIEEEVMAALFDVLDDAAQRADPGGSPDDDPDV